MLRLFLSYASQDVERVRRLSADLRRPGIEAWMDDELKLAGRWNDEIDDRIAASDFFVISQATQTGDAKRFFRKEWELAYKSRRRILPVRLEECELPASLSKGLATAIGKLQREDLFPSYEEGLRRILRFLHEAKRTGIFEETFSCLGADNPGWRLHGWQLDDADSTGENSRSIHAAAQLSPTQLLPQTSTHTAAIDIDLPGRPLIMRYRRRIQLSAPVGGGRLASNRDGRRRGRHSLTREFAGERMDHPLCAHPRPWRASGDARAHRLRDRQYELLSFGRGVGGRFARIA